MKLVSKNVLIILTLLCIASCKHGAGYDVQTLTSANMAFEKGHKALNENKYHDAAEYFTQIYFLNPEFPKSEQALCLEIYSLFMARMFGETIDACDFMIKLYPASSKIEFIHYMKALSYYVQIDHVSLDQSNTENAKRYFDQFILDYPKSKFISFAKEKIIVINERLAGKEMNIGRYYLNRNGPIAAVPRFQKVLMNYSESNQVPEALYRLVVSFMMMGMPDEAIKYASILGHNFRDSDWYKYSYDLLSSHNISHSMKGKLLSQIGKI